MIWWILKSVTSLPLSKCLLLNNWRDDYWAILVKCEMFKIDATNYGVEMVPSFYIECVFNPATMKPSGIVFDSIVKYVMKALEEVFNGRIDSELLMVLPPDICIYASVYIERLDNIAIFGTQFRSVSLPSDRHRSVLWANKCITTNFVMCISLCCHVWCTPGTRT